MNIVDIIIAVVIAVWITASVLYLRKRKKKGCCSGCDGCPYSGSCSKEK